MYQWLSFRLLCLIQRACNNNAANSLQALLQQAVKIAQCKPQMYWLLSCTDQLMTRIEFHTTVIFLGMNPKTASKPLLLLHSMRVMLQTVTTIVDRQYSL